MNVLTYVCPNCGATLTHDATTQKLSCEHCHYACEVGEYKEPTETKPEPSSKPKESRSKEKLPGESRVEDEAMMVYSCPRCGGEILAQPTTAASFCIYCGDRSIFPERLSGEFRPESIIGFSKTKQDAVNAFLKLCKGRPLVPGDYTKFQNVDKITGVYVPFFLYDYDVSGDMAATGLKIQTWSDSRYHYTKTDYYDVRRSGKARFHNIPVDGSKEMENAVMDSIEPYEMKFMSPFRFGYLSGYLAQRPDEDKNQLEPRAGKRVKTTFESCLRNDIGGYASVTVNDSNIRPKNTEIKLCLLPVWVLNTRYKKKNYSFAMNGQTGKLAGSIPLSPEKTWLYFGLTLVLSFLMAFFGYTIFETFGRSSAESLQSEPYISLWGDIDTNQKVYDFANLLDDAAEVGLREKALAFMKNYDMDLAMVTSNNANGMTEKAYADNFYDYSGFGVGKDRSGLVLVINMDIRKIYISTCGKAISLYQSSIEDMLDVVAPLATSGKYEQVMEAFIIQSSSVAKASSPNIVKILIIFLLPFGIAGIVVLILRKISSITPSLAKTASEFLDRESLQITHRSDVFLRSHVSKVAKSSSSGKSGGGGGGHGGGGRSF